MTTQTIITIISIIIAGIFAYLYFNVLYREDKDIKTLRNTAKNTEDYLKKIISNLTKEKVALQKQLDSKNMRVVRGAKDNR